MTVAQDFLSSPNRRPAVDTRTFIIETKPTSFFAGGEAVVETEQLINPQKPIFPYRYRNKFKLAVFKLQGSSNNTLQVRSVLMIGNWKP